MPNLPIVPHFKTPFNNSFHLSFVICFLVSGIIMEFREWNLDRALYYGGFNLIVNQDCETRT
jgi:hypothetical protein